MKPEKILSLIENVEYDITELESELEKSNENSLSKQVKTFHNRFIDVIKNIENKVLQD